MSDANNRAEETMCMILALERLVRVGRLPSGGIMKSMGKTAHTHKEIITTPKRTHEAVSIPEEWTLSRSPTSSMRKVAASP
jgi:hypothetical protein